MGLFGKLFDKKECDICGGEIGLLGNKKLEDGNICKECAKKLSPFFTERKHSTLAEIQDQLAYREANKSAVAAFHATRIIGDAKKVYIDEAKNQFMVSDGRNITEENPDVINLSDVIDCTFDIKERRDEIKMTDKDGKRVSYNPPRYKYFFEFIITISVNNPYFDVMKFELPGKSITIEPRDKNQPQRPQGQGLVGALLGAAENLVFSPYNDPQYIKYRDMGEDVRRAILKNR